MIERYCNGGQIVGISCDSSQRPWLIDMAKSVSTFTTKCNAVYQNSVYTKQENPTEHKKSSFPPNIA